MIAFIFKIEAWKLTIRIEDFISYHSSRKFEEPDSIYIFKFLTVGFFLLYIFIWNNGTVVCITVFGGSNLYLSSKIWDIRQNPFYILSSLSHTHFNLMLLNVSSERNVYSLGINSISFFTIWQLYAWSLQLTHPRRLFFLAKTPKVFLIFWKTVCQE